MQSARDRRLIHEFNAMRRLRGGGSLIEFLCADMTGEEASVFLWSKATVQWIEQFRTGFVTPEQFQELYPGKAPEKYLVTFHCEGVEKLDPDGQPVISATHELEIVFGIDYPERPPLFIWLSPIWHPNFKHPYVCTYGRPFAVGTLLAQLCLTIGRMVSYHVYNLESPLNHEAAAWAKENERRFPIDRRSLADGLIHEQQDPGDLVQLVVEGEGDGPLVEWL